MHGQPHHPKQTPKPTTIRIWHKSSKLSRGMLEGTRFRVVSPNCLSRWSSLPSTRLPTSNSHERTIKGKRLCTARWMLMRDRSLTRGITCGRVISHTTRIDRTRAFKWAPIAKPPIKVNWGLRLVILLSLRARSSRYYPRVCQAHQ